MRFTRIVALLLTLAVPCAALAQQSRKPRPNSRKTAAPQSPRPAPSTSAAPPRMSPEKAFYYAIAIYGFYSFGDTVDQYGKSFDAGNYRRAIADEFERNRYRERIRALIAEEVRKLDFSEKFTLVGWAKLGEYSFKSHSFPFVTLPELTVCFDYPDPRGDRCHDNSLELNSFSLPKAVNGNDFDWSVPMSEAEASAFVKSRMANPGDVDRSIMVRITYSVVKYYDLKLFQIGNSKYYRGPGFGPFIYSVEAYADGSLSKKLAVIPKINSLGASTVEEWRLAVVAAQTATKEIGKYRFMAEEKSDGKIHNPFEKRPQLFGTITLTDVGISLSGQQQDGAPKMRSFSFFDSFYDGSHGRSQTWTTLRRANRTKDFRVVWSPFWEEDYGTELVFESLQERDRFFSDLASTFQEWKTKYAPFHFASGRLTIDQR